MRVLPIYVVVALLVSAAGAPVPARSAGVYEPLPINEREKELIDSSNELEGYFSSQSLIHRDEALLALVERVGRELAPPPTDPYIHYQFFVLRDPSPNAFSLPNGHVYVQTGMLARLEDSAQLAALLAHEINHVAGHHSILE
jgi:predicted Zn-dependent protease